MRSAILLAACAALLAGCTTPPPEDDARRQAQGAFERSFTHGNKEMFARVVGQDDVQALCSRWRNRPPADVAERIRKSQAATLVYPADGKLMGDWRQGEKIAEDGFGLRFTDTNQPKRPNGGNCYACHQLAPHEVSYGTLGPSLYRFGRTRGSSEAIQRYVYGKVYNPEAFTACSGMPRFGLHQVLTPEQIRHVVALLLDPESPVNQ
ncbi:MAG TPA: sulfur oxidation c-type cytochrome SoxX [Burkholderiales bacterium]